MLNAKIVEKRGIVKILLILAILMLCPISNLFAIDPLVESDLYDQIKDMQQKGNIVVEGERRGYITQNIPLKHNMSLLQAKAYLAVVVTDKNLHNIDLQIKNKNGFKVIKSSDGEQVLLLKISPLENNEKFSFQLDTEELGGYYHFFLISDSQNELSKA
jgi:hypothetical protein